MSATRVREQRACPVCGEVAWRKIWLKPDGSDEFKPNPCGICDALAQAAKHRRAADAFTALAAKLQKRREKAKALHDRRVHEREQRDKRNHKS